MKRSILLIVSFSAAFSVCAQPVLTSDINLSIGDTYRYDGYTEVTNIEPGPGGANLIWDFSDITGEMFIEGVAAICVDPATTPFADSAAVADANICTKNVDDIGPFQYFDNDNSSQNVIAMGFVAEAGSSFGTYTDIMTVCEFPFTYNDSFDDTWEFINFSINGGYYDMRDSSFTTVEADAYGTITTPLGVFPDALRVKTTTVDYSWMRFEAGGDWIPLGFSTDIEYKWYAPNIKTPVMYIIEKEDFPSYDVRYLVEYNFQVGIEEQSEVCLEIFPNPTTDRLNIKTNEVIYHISVFSLSGQLMDTVLMPTNPPHQHTVNLSNYPKGIYFIEVGFKDGSTLTERVIKH
ncbi:MAG: T9SS type A sorting domain-containing protein [Bacteroidales bacterium]|nr:T9SS type A sorting domain-containing protein [Bacteroidales bacterium]